MDNWNGIISLFVACIELILIINLLALAPKTKVNKLAILIIGVLFIYQLLEFLMCHFGIRSSFVAYLAFADISFLPPLTLYTILNFLEYPGLQLSRLTFLPAISFVFYYALVIPEFQVVSCTVLYASFNYPYGTLYGAFYYIPLLISMILLYLEIRNKKNKKKSFLSKVLLTAFIIIFLPVMAAFIFAALGSNVLLNAVESIMCKFALVIAISFTFFCLYDRKPADEKIS